MKATTVYKVIIAILLLLNIVQISAFLLGTKPPKGNAATNFKGKAVEMLNLSKLQAQKFNSYAKAHQKEMRLLEKQQVALTGTYFYKPTDSILNLISTVEIQKIKMTEVHFTEIEKMLEPNQMENFYRFKKSAIKHVLGGNKHKMPPPNHRRKE